MDSHPPDPSEPKQDRSEVVLKTKERVITAVVMGLVLLSALWSLRTHDPPPNPRVAAGSGATIAVAPESVPLTTGEEPIAEIFMRAGCPVCHVIPGIPGANGRVGPKLVLGTTGSQRLSDPAYGGGATTIRGYVVESVLEPDRFVVPGYPGGTMPGWYGMKLSALALEKIAAYLERQTEAG